MKDSILCLRQKLEARKEILFEQYAGVRNIEALTMIDMASKMFIPSVVYYTKNLLIQQLQ